MTQSASHTFTIKTWADSRSNRRDRTYVVEMPTAWDAKESAMKAACRDMRQWGRTVETQIIDVDGKGAPTDCPHDESRKWDGFSYRADGGRDCRACAGA